MTLGERRKYLPLLKKRNRKASKLERTQLLDEMQAVTAILVTGGVAVWHPAGPCYGPRQEGKGLTRTPSRVIVYAEVVSLVTTAATLLLHRSLCATKMPR
jgi:hypothetical protein